MPTFHISSGHIQGNEIKTIVRSLLKTEGWIEHSNDMNVDVILVFAFLEKESPKMKTNSKVKVIQLLTGSSKDILTTKSKLYKRFAGYSFIPNTIVFESDDIPNGIFRKVKILKPTEGFAGKGITIVNNIAGVRNWVEINPQFKEWSLQDYIHPETINGGYKFHLRIYLLIVCSKNIIKVFIPAKFGMNIANKKYTEDYTGDLSEIHNVHETTLGYTFPSKIPDGWDESDVLLSMRRIRKMIIDILEEEHTFKPDWGAQNGFELFGLDVMFERKTKKPILIEFNKKPGLSNPFIIQLIPSILKESIGVGNVESLFTRII